MVAGCHCFGTVVVEIADISSFFVHGPRHPHVMPNELCFKKFYNFNSAGIAVPFTPAKTFFAHSRAI